MEENQTGEYVEGTVVFRAGNLISELKVDQMPRSFVYDGVFVDLPLHAGAAMSPNGRYVAYIDEAELENGYEYKPYLMDTKTRKITELEMPPYTGAGAGTLNYQEIKCLSDDARILVFYNSASTIQAMTIGGEPYEVKAPAGYDYPIISDMSGDGRIWVGDVYDTNEKSYWPCRWIDGEPEILERPEFQVDGVTPTSNGAMARGCSYDGSVIYGSEWNQFLLVYWKDGKLFNIGQEQADWPSGALKTEAQSTRLSPDGKYIAMKYGGEGMYKPALVNTSTGQHEVLECVADGTGITVGPDGTVFGATPSSPVMQGYVFDFENNSATTLKDWMQEKYGITIDGSRMVYKVSIDGKVLFGKKHVSVGGNNINPCWFIRLED